MRIFDKSLLIALAFFHSIFAGSWTPRAFFPGPDQEVTSLLAAGASLYAGGAFATFGPFGHTGLMRWEGEAWSPVGSGLEGTIQGLAIDGRGLLYASGKFSRQDGTYGLAVWDGTAWSFPSGAKGLAGWGPITAVGNAAFLVFESEPREIYRCDGSALIPLEAKADGFILALEVMGNALIAGGEFSTIGGVAANHVARFGTGWGNMAEGVDMDLRCLAVVDGVLLAGGGIRNTVPSAPSLARWDGQRWSDFGSLPADWGYIGIIAGGAGRIYAGGDILPIQGESSNGRQILSEWDGSVWKRIDDHVLNYDIRALAVLNGTVWAGGRFHHPSAPYLGQWHGKAWSPPFASATQAPSGTISVLNARSGRMLAAGSFKVRSADSVNLLCEWTGSGWVERGSALSVSDAPVLVTALEPHGDDVYLCASFHSSITPPGLLRLSNGAWKPIGDDLGIEVLRSAPDGLYAGGRFTRLGNVDARHIARWDGAAWHAVGGGLDFPVTALEWDGSSLYAAQANTESDSGIPSQVSRFSGGQWTVLGATASAPLFNGVIRALAMKGGELWAAGELSGVGLFNVKGVAVWNGSVWRGTAGGLADVHALTVSPKGELYATGKFSDPSGSVAHWNGIAWEALGEGLAVYDTNYAPMGRTVACLGEDLFVAGGFVYAGGKPSPGFARWTQVAENLGVLRGDRRARIARPVWRLFPDGRLIFVNPSHAIGFDAMGRRRYDLPDQSKKRVPIEGRSE